MWKKIKILYIFRQIVESFFLKSLNTGQLFNYQEKQWTEREKKSLSANSNCINMVRNLQVILNFLQIKVHNNVYIFFKW